jgi:hypothetical protein
MLRSVAALKLPLTHLAGRPASACRRITTALNGPREDTLWALLAPINDLPVTIENIEPSKIYVARGRYKKFLQHWVVHLTVPEARCSRNFLRANRRKGG